MAAKFQFTWPGDVSYATRDGQILKRPFHRVDTEKACLRCASWYDGSVHLTLQTSSRNLCNYTCTASLLCEFFGGPSSGWTSCTFWYSRPVDTCESLASSLTRFASFEVSEFSYRPQTSLKRTSNFLEGLQFPAVPT